MKNFVSVVLIAIPMLLSMPACQAESVKTLDIHLSMDENKRVSVVEDITIDFSPTRTEPFVRVIPENQIHGSDAVANEMINGNKTMTIVNTSKDDKAHTVSLTISKPGSPPNGLHQYKIEYHTDQAIKTSGKNAEFVWNATGDNWTMPIDSVNLFATLPSAMAKDDVKATATTGNASEKKDIQVEKSDVYVKCQSGVLYPGNNLTLHIALPKDSVIEGATPKEGPEFWETDWGRGLIGLGVLLLIGLLWSLFLAKRDHIGR